MEMTRKYRYVSPVTQYLRFSPRIWCQYGTSNPREILQWGSLRKGNRMVNTFPFEHTFFHVNENLERFPHVDNILSNDQSMLLGI